MGWKMGYTGTPEGGKAQGGMPGGYSLVALEKNGVKGRSGGSVREKEGGRPPGVR